MKILYALALTLLLGCATSHKTPVTGEIVSNFKIVHELRPLMAEHRGQHLVLMDEVYGPISEADTRKLISEAFRTFNPSYILEARDCDDLAIELVVKLRVLFRRDTGSVPLGSTVGVVAGALVGDIPELNFVASPEPFYHAMAVVRCAGGKWLLIEPASKQVCEFTGTIYEGSFEFILGIF